MLDALKPDHEFRSRSAQVPTDEDCDDTKGTCEPRVPLGKIDRSLVEINVEEEDLPMKNLPKESQLDDMKSKSRSVLDFFDFLNIF